MHVPCSPPKTPLISCKLESFRPIPSILCVCRTEKRSEARAGIFAKTATSENGGTFLGTDHHFAEIDEGVFPGSVLYLLTSTSISNAMLVEQADKARRGQISEYRRRWFHNEGSEKSTNQRQELYNSALRSQTLESVVQDMRPGSHAKMLSATYILARTRNRLQTAFQKARR